MFFFTITPFNVLYKDLGDGNELHIIDIDQIDQSLTDCIDEKFVKICEGNSGTDLSLVKQRLVKFLTPKKGSTTEGGAIAEFFLHLFLNQSGFTPQFLYFNLEEGSIKKGFDGYYLYNGEEWILESKSGSITTAGISHSSKVKEAYEDLYGKLAGKGTNNPWRNAYNHASHIDVGAENSVRASISKFSNEYVKGKFHKIDDFNVIPGSTIFLNGTWIAPDASTIETEMEELVKTLKFKKIKIVCITKKSIQIFWDYLNRT
jgi:hypothetical protein